MPRYEILLEGFCFGRRFDSLFGFGLGDGFSKNAFERVDLVLDVIAELERRNNAFFNLDDVTGTRITCRSCLARFAGEGAEATNFDGIAFNQLLGKKTEELLHNDFDVVTHKSGGFGDFLNKILFSYISHDLNIGLSTT